ncbi:MAG: HEAT repeat domain-containing protein [Gemmataceae bacterium]
MTRRDAVLGFVAVLALACRSGAQTDADLGALREFKVEPTAAGLLSFLRKRTPAREVIERVDGYVARLGDDEHRVREQATLGLIDIGVAARGRLTDALGSADAEVRRRARWALDRITPPADDSRILPAVARLLAARKPAGAAEALLDVLPHVEGADVADELARSLAPLAAGKDGVPPAAVVKALGSGSKAQRAAAGVALAAGPEGSKALARKLLDDEAVGVRRRVAVALAEGGDGKALPALAALAGSDSDEDRAAAEEVLHAVAGDEAPEGSSSADRGAARKAWEGWLKADGGKVDLTKVSFDAPGGNLTLVGSWEVKGGRRQAVVSALAPAGAVKWQLDVAGGTQMHASLARRDRVLVAEYNHGRVQEYDLKGKVHWTHVVLNPVAAYRLRNGNTFVATRNSLIVLDRDRRAVRTVRRPGSDVASATVFEDGRMAVMTTGGTVVRYDKEGKEAGSVNTGRYVTAHSRVQFNADGSFVVPEGGTNRVWAYEKDGKVRWEAVVAYIPSFVVAQPGGGVWVGSRSWSDLIELDPKGKEVRRRKTSGTQMLFLERR